MTSGSEIGITETLETFDPLLVGREEEGGGGKREREGGEREMGSGDVVMVGG